MRSHSEICSSEHLFPSFCTKCSVQVAGKFQIPRNPQAEHSVFPTPTELGGCYSVRAHHATMYHVFPVLAQDFDVLRALLTFDLKRVYSSSGSNDLPLRRRSWRVGAVVFLFVFLRISFTDINGEDRPDLVPPGSLLHMGRGRGSHLFSCQRTLNRARSFLQDIVRNGILAAFGTGAVFRGKRIWRFNFRGREPVGQIRGHTLHQATQT